MTKVARLLIIHFLTVALAICMSASAGAVNDTTGPVSVLRNPADYSGKTVSQQTSPVSVLMNPEHTGKTTTQYTRPVSVLMNPEYSGKVAGHQTPPVSIKFEGLKEKVPGLIAYWPMDTDWLDHSGNYYHGAAGGGVGFAGEGKIGGDSGSFDGADDGVRVNEGKIISQLDAWSFEAWVNSADMSPSPDGANRRLYAEGGSNSDSFCVRILTDSRIGVDIFRSGNVRLTLFSNTSLNTNEWTHVASTFDTEGLKIYINGELDAQDAAIVNKSNINVTRADIGRFVDAGGTPKGFFSGLLDDMALFERALSADEVYAHFLNGISATMHAPKVDEVVTPTADKTIALTGGKDPGTSVWINGVEVVPMDSSATWQAEYTLKEGTNYIKVSLRDSQDNASEEIVVVVELDTVPPEPGTVSINGQAEYTDSVNVALDVTATDNLSGVAQMSFSNDGTKWSGWEPYSETYEGWILDASGDSGKTVYARFMDAVGNVSASVSDTVILDTSPPGPPSITEYPELVGDGTATVAGTRPADAASVIVFVNGVELEGAQVTYADSTSWSVTVSGLAKGGNVVSAASEDAAGNRGPQIAGVNIFYDTVPPAWATSEGVRFVEPGDGSATVRWNGARDGEGAGVVYNVYVSETQPIDYSTANRATVYGLGEAVKFNAAEGFSDVQGENNWYYLYWNGNGYSEMTFDTVENRWEQVYPALLWADGGHPGVADSAKAWKAPASGTVRVTGSAYDANPTAGDGVTVSIRHNDEILWERRIENADSTRYEYDLTFDVVNNDYIYFRFNMNDYHGSDGTYFNPTVEFSASEAPAGGKGYDHEFTLDGMTNNTEYYVAVRAADEFGNEEDNSLTFRTVPQATAGAVVADAEGDFGCSSDGLTATSDGTLILAPEYQTGTYTSCDINIPEGSSVSAAAYSAVGGTVTLELDNGLGWTAVTDAQQSGLPSGDTLRYRITVSVADGSAPIVDSVSLSYNDFVPPAPPTVGQVESPTNVPTQVITGTKDAGSSVLINGVEFVPVTGETAWSATVALKEGDNNLEAKSADAAGNVSPASQPVQSVLLDTTPPDFTVEFESPSVNVVQVLTGTKEPGCVLSLDGTVIADETDMSSTWSHEIALLNGLLNVLTFRASDGLGNSVTKTVKILCDTSAPTPLGPGVLEAYGEGDGTTVTLKWLGYDESLVPDLGYYKAYVSETSFTSVSGMTSAGNTNKGVRKFVVSGLEAGTSYYFAVVPVDQNGNYDIAVNTATGSPVDTLAPEEVTNLTATSSYDVAAGENTIMLGWTPSVDSRGDLAGLKLYFDDGNGYDSGTPVDVTETSYTKSRLADNRHVKFRLTVLDSLGNESNGRVVEATTRLPNPANVTTAPGNGQVTVSWDRVVSPYLKNYKVYMLASDQQQGNVSDMALVQGTTGTSLKVTGLDNDTTYQFSVTTFNTSGAENTTANSVQSAPRSDATGPVIDSFIVKVGGQTVPAGGAVTRAASIEVTAHDDESQVASLGLIIDGTQVDLDVGSSLSYTWDVVPYEDGNHTLAVFAVDAPGNRTEQTVVYAVSLLPPSAPVINDYDAPEVNGVHVAEVLGTAEKWTEVTLFVDGVMFGSTQTSGTQFQFGGIELAEGTHSVAAKASHRGGDSPYSAVITIVIDTGAPAPPVSLAANVLDGGRAKFTWLAGVGEVPSGYNLYRSASAFTSADDSGVVKVNTSAIKYGVYTHKPPDDTEYFYGVTAEDGVGNESVVSDVIPVVTDRVAPDITGIGFVYTDRDNEVFDPATVIGTGKVSIALSVSEPPGEPPFFSITPAAGSPIIVTLSTQDNLNYTGSFNVTSLTPHGDTEYRFTCKDKAGNRCEVQGASPAIDVKGPVASIVSPSGLLEVTDQPVTVSVKFDEPPVGLPQLELVDSNGVAVAVEGLLDTGDGLSFEGVVDVSGMADGDAKFRLVFAVDILGNESVKVGAGADILLYTGTPPPPSTPANLAAKPLSGGWAKVTWNAVPTAESYNLYRRLDTDTSAVMVKSGLTTCSFTDLPDTDGEYYYSVASVGQLSSESAPSAEVMAISDSTAPGTPDGLSLVFGADGVTATWNASAWGEPAAYRLYRSAVAIDTDSIASLTAVLGGIKTLTASDASPENLKRYYAVTAVDALGNESEPSENAQITFPVAPVRDLVLTVVDGTYPLMSWTKPQPSVVGYLIYKDGEKLTPQPVDYTVFTDGYYTGGATLYGVSAVDSYGNESPVKTIEYSGFMASLQEGVTLNRGYLQVMPIQLSNPGESTVEVDGIEVKVGSSPSSNLAGPFVAAPLAETTVEKIAATALDSPPVVGVSVTATMTPSPGVTVITSSTRSAEAAGAGATIEILSDELVRGAQASVRLKLFNLGDADMDVVTSQNGGQTSMIKVYLKDQDGNVLAQAGLNQRADYEGKIINGTNYAVARIVPGGNFVTDEMTVTVPPSAPYAVYVEAVVTGTYYHYGKPEQVAAPGVRQVLATDISETTYRAIASVETTFLPAPEPVQITGQAINNNTGEPMGLVPVVLGVSVKGFDRFYTLNTDSDGNFAYTFKPGSTEAGVYTVWARHPDVNTRSIQDSFTIAGLYMSPSNARITVLEGGSYDIPLTIKNTGGTSLTGLSYAIQASEGFAATVINGPSSIGAGKSVSAKLRVSASANAPDSGYVKLDLTTNEGATRSLDVTVGKVTAIPIIDVKPKSYIDTGIVRGDQRVVSLTLQNDGAGTLKNARVEGPSLPWVTLASSAEIGDVAPDGKSTIAVLLRPGESVEQKVYNDSMLVVSDNHIPYRINIQCTVVTDAIGSAQFDVINSFAEKVDHASVRIQNASLTELTYLQYTDQLGTTLFADIPAGNYLYTVSATGCKPFSGSFEVLPGLVQFVPVGIEVTLVEVEFTVTPITVEDRYEITITQTFKTDVPVPVLVMEPPAILLPKMAPGQVYNGEITMSNYGLIGLNNVYLNYPRNFKNYTIEFLGVVPDTLGPKQSVTIPFRVTKTQ